MSPARRRLRVEHRLVIPLVLAAGAASVAITWVGVRSTAGALQSRLEAQLLESASSVTWRSFAMSSPVLQNLRPVIGADILTLGPDGHLLASSLDQPKAQLLASAQAAIAAQAPGPSPRLVSADCGFPCAIAYRTVDSQPGTTVVLVADTSPVAAATTAVERTILLSAAISVALLVLVSRAVVKGVTAPLDRLVGFVRALGPLESSVRAEVGDDEIGALASSFNGMLDRLDQSRVALVRSEKLGLAGLFAARVAHDIRNPLSSIKMQSQLLRSKLGAGTDAHDVLSAVLRDVAQVESVVRDLMDLANPGALALQPGDLNAVLRGAVDQLSHQLAYRKIDVALALTEPLPPIALDTQRLRQALLNVLVNASEAMHTGGELRVSTKVDGDTIRVQICDDGVGIDPALAERVFDPFVSTKPEGVGLGLVNVKAVVEGHGGGIRLEPRQPRGTCADIWLPVSRHG